MSQSYTVKPTHKPIKDYYAALATFREHRVGHEQAVRAAFQNLLTATGKKHGWTLIAEERINIKGKTVIPDGTFRDQYEMHRGHWEAKDIGRPMTPTTSKPKSKRKSPQATRSATSSSKTPAVAICSKTASKLCGPTWPIRSSSAIFSTRCTPTPSRPTKTSTRQSMTSRRKFPGWPRRWWPKSPRTTEVIRTPQEFQKPARAEPARVTQALLGCNRTWRTVIIFSMK